MARTLIPLEENIQHDLEEDYHLLSPPGRRGLVPVVVAHGPGSNVRKIYGIDLATRKPRELLRAIGAPFPRLAIRTRAGSLNQEPPR